MNKNKIILTAFRGSSAEQLLKYANGFDKLILPNDKVGDAEKLKQVISKMNYDFVVSLGQKPNIKNKEIFASYDYCELDVSLPACIFYENRGFKTVKHVKYDIGDGAFMIYEIMRKEKNGLHN